ncbi:putative F-box domain-containing protein [Medicago truncatula]|uniref:Putative F-box domain-containing protein n=1 Tax=Medicago truncatula TaxID=3880 RepID=A0A396IDQ5_MEDTR|nr:putative F-box domain-containing protein [Medicago truncatula]
METTTLPHMPNELMIQILLRLPVKSLIRFKSVCKSWFSLVSDTHFAYSHFNFPPQHTLVGRVLFISTSARKSRSIDLDLEASPLDDDDSSLYLWNPFIRVHKEIPLSPFGSNLDTDYFYGFGYDQSTNDYLVVSM